MDETLFKVKVNQIEMLKKRGFDVSPEESLPIFNLRGFLQYYTAKIAETGQTIYQLLTRLYENPLGEMVYVYYSPVTDKSTGKSTVLELINEVNGLRREYNNSLNKAIIISRKGLSPDASNQLKNMPLYLVQSFIYSELTWNITKHILTDPHLLLTDEDTRALLAENPFLSLEKMPFILDSDPMAKYLGAVPGQVIKIKRRVIFYPAMVDVAVVYRLVKSEAEAENI